MTNIVPKKTRQPRARKIDTTQLPDDSAVPTTTVPVLAADSAQQARAELYGDLVVNFLHADGLQDSAEGEVALRRRTGIAHKRALIVMDELEKLNG